MWRPSGEMAGAKSSARSLVSRCGRPLPSESMSQSLPVAVRPKCVHDLRSVRRHAGGPLPGRAVRDLDGVAAVRAHCPDVEASALLPAKTRTPSGPVRLVGDGVAPGVGFALGVEGCESQARTARSLGDVVGAIDAGCRAGWQRARDRRAPVSAGRRDTGSLRPHPRGPGRPGPAAAGRPAPVLADPIAWPGSLPRSTRRWRWALRRPPPRYRQAPSSTARRSSVANARQLGNRSARQLGEATADDRVDAARCRIAHPRWVAGCRGGARAAAAPRTGPRTAACPTGSDMRHTRGRTGRSDRPRCRAR